MDKSIDYFYELLGLSKDSTAAEVKAKCREMILKFHPDRNKSPNANEFFEEIIEARDRVMADISGRNDGEESDGDHSTGPEEQSNHTMEDYYQIMGIDESYTVDEVTEKYHEMRKTFAGMPKILNLINEAYTEIMPDVEKNQILRKKDAESRARRRKARKRHGSTHARDDEDRTGARLRRKRLGSKFLKAAVIPAVIIAVILFIPDIDPLDLVSYIPDIPVWFPGTYTDVDVREIERLVHEGTNAQRVKRGLHPLGHDANLAFIAERHSEDMAKRDHFAHEFSGEMTLRERGLGAGFDICGKDRQIYERFLERYDSISTGEQPSRSPERDILVERLSQMEVRIGIGENIYHEEGSHAISEKEIAARIVKEWMDDPKYGKNMLDDWDAGGIGVTITPGGLYAAQNFC